VRLQFARSGRRRGLPSQLGDLTQLGLDQRVFIRAVGAHLRQFKRAASSLLEGSGVLFAATDAVTIVVTPRCLSGDFILSFISQILLF